MPCARAAYLGVSGPRRARIDRPILFLCAASTKAGLHVEAPVS
jgi:hypothetical protein